MTRQRITVAQIEVPAFLEESVAENIDRWMGTARSATPEPSGPAATDGGTVTDGGSETPPPAGPSATDEGGGA